MPLVTIKPMLKQAQGAKYGIAAFNMIDYNSARAVIDGAAELNAPIIVQVAVKTIKLWGHQPIADLDECLTFCAELPELAVFAPAIGTAQGFYKGTPKIAYERLARITSTVDIPIALHGGTGQSEDQFHRCINAGCSKMNISTMHKRQFIEGFVGLRAAEPDQSKPIPFIAAQYDALKSDVRDMVRIFGSEEKAAAPASAYS